MESYEKQLEKQNEQLQAALAAEQEKTDRLSSHFWKLTGEYCFKHTDGLFVPKTVAERYYSDYETAYKFVEPLWDDVFILASAKGACKREDIIPLCEVTFNPGETHSTWEHSDFLGGWSVSVIIAKTFLDRPLFIT